MPRRPRNFVEGGIDHVYNRFARGAENFVEGDGAESFLEHLRKVRNRDGLTGFTCCIMSDHCHLAVRSGPAPLSRTIGSGTPKNIDTPVPGTFTLIHPANIGTVAAEVYDAEGAGNVLRGWDSSPRQTRLLPALPAG